MLQLYRNVTQWCEAMDQHIVKHKPEQEVKLIKSQSFLVLSVAHYTLFYVMSLENPIHSELSFNTHHINSLELLQENKHQMTENMFWCGSS